VVERHGGRFPSREAALRALPGIGDYTAAAVAAIAFGEASTVVDGNVERVMARLHAIATPVPAARPEIRRLTAALVPPARPGDFAQAMMDLGATICTPRSPACAICPLRDPCAARAAGTQLHYPRKAPKTTGPRRHGAMAVVERHDGAVLVRTRPARGLLGGMTEFFGSAWGAAPPDTAALAAASGAALEAAGRVEHAFTHFALTLDVYRGRSVDGRTPEGCRWVSPSDLGREPIPNVFAKVWDASRASAVVPLGLDRQGLVSLEEADQQRGRDGEDREAQARHAAAQGRDVAEAEHGRSRAEGRQGQQPTQHGVNSAGPARRDLA
jgi:A/G-specific adenine glycosylase